MSGLDQFLELHKLLLSGDYLMEDEISFLDFMRLLKLLFSSRKLSVIIRKSDFSFSTVFGVLEFLRNISLIELDENGKLRILNKEILKEIYFSPQLVKMKLKFQLKFTKRIWFHSKKKKSLLSLFDSSFILSKTNFQLPCSIKTSYLRAIMILQNIYFETQNALLFGDDDMVSLVLKYLNPNLSITVIEIDGRLTKLLKKIAHRKKYKSFEIYNNDFNELVRNPEVVKKKYSIIHLDPPYEPKKLSKFLSNLPQLFNEKMVQIYLNGTYDNESRNIINSFLLKNKLKIVDYCKSFNNYPCKSTDFNYIDSLKKDIRRYYDFKLNRKYLKKLRLSSDLLMIENTIEINAMS